MPNTLASILVGTARQMSERPAIKHDDYILSYGELLDSAAAVAGDMHQRGIRPGDRVGIVLPNVPAFPVIFYATQIIGAIAVPLNPMLTERELKYFVADADMSIIYGLHGSQELGLATQHSGTETVFVDTAGPRRSDIQGKPLSEPVPRDSSDTAVLLYTSGTTGRPKGAELTQANMCSNAATTVSSVIQTTPTDVILGCLPLFHVFGLTCGLNAAVSTGAMLTLIPKFSAEQAIEVLARDEVTVLEGVPTMYAGILNSPHSQGVELSNLRCCIVGGAPMPVEVLKNFEQRFGCEIFEGYGLSETSPIACFNQLSVDRRPGTIGLPVQGCALRLVADDGSEITSAHEPGEIQVKGENVMKGYWGRPEETEQAIRDGWFSTGDIGTRDDDGYYRIIDRKKDLIISGGFNVYPREVEEVLYEHPAVAEAAVIGIDDSYLGERVGAAVTLRADASVTEAELSDFVRERLARYKCPRTIWFVTSVPKGPTGKILRRSVTPPVLTSPANAPAGQ